jgi:hypothetical protein
MLKQIIMVEKIEVMVEVRGKLIIDNLVRIWQRDFVADFRNGVKE